MHHVVLTTGAFLMLKLILHCCLLCYTFCVMCSLTNQSPNIYYGFRATEQETLAIYLPTINHVLS
jgi:hypothetical protein